jgi:hypothetical protein
MALHTVRNVLGGTIPIKKGTAAAAIAQGCPVYRNVADGKMTAVATNGTKILGFAASATTAADQEIDYIPGYPGLEFLLDYSGTASITELGTYVAITVTSGAPIANCDKADADALRLEAVHDSTAATAWFSLADTANQTLIEVV